MKQGVPIPFEWVEYLRQQPETGMGYQVVAVFLGDGRTFNQVVAEEGYFTQVRGCSEMPFSVHDEIRSVKVTHKRWNFNEK